MKKFVLISIAALVVVVAGVVWFTLSNLDGIVKAVIEGAGSKITGTAVKLNKVEIDLSDGRATLWGLSVANPPGFSSQPAISFGEITVQLDLSSGVIKKIVTAKPRFRFEQKGATSNIGQLQNNIKKATASDQEDGSKKPPSPAEEISEDTHLQIDLIQITEAQVHVTSPQLKKDADIRIKSLVFRNLKGSGKQVAGQILEQLTAKIAAAAAEKAIRSQMEKAVGEKTGGIKGFLNNLGK